MPFIDLLNQDYPSKSLDQNQSQLTNMYLEADQAKGKYKVIALPTPGLTTFCDTGKSVIRDMYKNNEVLYVVAGDTFYSINSAGTKTSLGTLNTSTGFAKIVDIAGGIDTNNQIFIIDGTNCYSYNLGSSTATFPITDLDCPQTSIDLAAQDDYVILANGNSIQFNISSLSDTLTWSALDFASKISRADRLVGILSSRKKLWLFGNSTTEVWYNSGNASFPFEAVPDVFIEYGCAAKRSIAKGNGVVLFLAKNDMGGVSVLQADELLNTIKTPTSITTPPYEALISSFATISDAIGHIFTKDGHSFYILTFPTEGYTFLYDFTTGIWSQMQSNVSSDYTRFLGNCMVNCYNKLLIGDYNSGKIYYADTDNYTENGTAIRRIFVSPPIYHEGKRIIASRLQIDVETGIGDNKTFTLEKSLDNGGTWSTVGTYTVPAVGGRIFATSLGSSRSGFIFKITTTMDAKFILLGFVLEFKLGHS